MTPADRIRSRFGACVDAFSPWGGRQRMGLKPKRPGCSRRIGTGLLPPCRFVTAAMDFAMVSAAEWHGEFVAHLAAKRPILGKAQMVRIGWRAAADQTGLLDDEPHVFAVAYPSLLGMS